MNILFGNKMINEGFGDGPASFKNADVAIGPDGTIYDTSVIIGLVNEACDILIDITNGIITKYLTALPIIYTFQIPTMATDKKFIYINPGFVMTLFEKAGHTVVGIAFVIIHEVYHNLFMHADRENADPARFSDHAKANMAQDYEINWAIEHSFPDMRDDGDFDPNDPDDSPFELVNGMSTRKQIFNGISEAMGGLIDSKFANMLWEDIYDNMTSSDMDQPDNDMAQNAPIQMSPDFNDGYRDGWNDVIREARAKGLLESVIITEDFLSKCISLFESAKSNDYNTGYSEGRRRAEEMLNSIFANNGGSADGSDKSNSSDEQRYAPISGLETMKPINPPANSGGSSHNQDPNAPCEIKPQNSQSQSGSQSDQQSQQSTEDNGENTGNSGQSSDNGQMTQQGNSTSGQDNAEGNIKKSYDDIKNTQGTSGSASSDASNANQQGQPSTDKETVTDKKESPFKVITADGRYTGKSGKCIGEHIISKDEGDAIRQTAGVTKDEKLHGDGNSVFDKSNIKDIEKTLNKLSSHANKGGSFTKSSGPGQGIYGRISTKCSEIFTPVVDWRTELENKVDGAFMKLEDAGWSKKNISRDRYTRIYDYEGDELQNLIIMFDTSGSVMSKPDFVNQVVSEFMEIGRSVNPQCIDLVLFCDGIYYEEKIDDDDNPDLSKILENYAVTGGTSYMDCFNYIQTEYIDAGDTFGCCIIFTDTDLYYSKIPAENDLEWDPGHDNEDDSKLIWFVLEEDSERPIPYGARISISPDAFEKSIGFKTTESFLPKNYIRKSETISESSGRTYKRIRFVRKK